MDKLMLLLIAMLSASPAFAFPFAPAAGQPGSTAVHLSDTNFVAWADGYTNLVYGTDVTAPFQTPARALGPAIGGTSDIVSLGRGGQITLVFSQGITDGSGYDFAVFENGFQQAWGYFLELAWTEVSSDGVHYTRFPNYSYTAAPVGSFGGVDPTYVYGLGSKYRDAYGTPYDLSELQTTADAIESGTHNFSVDYATAFTNSFAHLDIADIRYVRIIDVVGNGAAFDAEGYVIYDPYPTYDSAGFDLEAIGVFHQPSQTGTPQSITFDPIPHQQLSFGSVMLEAEASSGLPVSFAIQSGPASVSNNVLTFSSTGIVEVVAMQAGDGVYASAAPLLRSFQVADEVQHIFVEPIPNQLAGSYTVPVKACSSSGLPVRLEVYRGPNGVVIDPANHVMTITNEIGSVTLRAFQPGDGSTAPAPDIFVDFEITDAVAGNAPVAWTDWIATNEVPEVAITPAADAYGRPAVMLEYTLDRRAAAFSRVDRSFDLDLWTNCVPEILEMGGEGMKVEMSVRLPADEAQAFYRLIFEAQ